VSDQGDFRGSREEKRKEETVMLSADQLGDMMAAAKASPATPEPDPAPEAPVEAVGGSGPNMAVILGAAAAVLVIVVVLVVLLGR
jgi:hypothetical protein